MTASILAEVPAADLFGADNINWQYCVKHATFQHKDKDACEFILHCGEEDYLRETVEEMKAFGCTSLFIGLYQAAARMGATRVLFWV